MGKRFLPSVEVVFDHGALAALQKVLKQVPWEWLRQLRGHEEVLLRADVGQLVELPGLPAMFRLRVIGKSIRVPGEGEGEPYVSVTLGVAERPS
jgi:hypothetical protein